MRAYAEAEVQSLRDRQKLVGDSLRDVLYDKAAGSDRASLIVEVRAGTGGDEGRPLRPRPFRDVSPVCRGPPLGPSRPSTSSPTELGGFREASFGISGEGAFRHLQFESGVHRVQRVPSTETQGRIHTSAATVAVLPEPEDVEIVIRAEDIDRDVMRAGGPGGQHQNKTESAVRLTHKPSGIVVVCRDERSQHKNQAKAMRLLRSRLYDLTLAQAQSDRAEQRRTLVGSGDRSQKIRTYSFPQNRVTDHRIGQTWYNLDRIIAGDLEPVATALIDHDRREQLGDLSD